jgi:hypothetical protein
MFQRVSTIELERTLASIIHCISSYGQQLPEWGYLLDYGRTRNGLVPTVVNMGGFKKL